MPNWCTNTLSITGNVSTLCELKTVIEADREGLLEAIAPLQGEWSHGEACETWGTKWDISTEGLEYTDNGDGTAEITGWFDSAWSPPIYAYNTFCEDMDGVYLEAYYEEGGMCFVGYWSSEGGDDYYEYGEATSKTINDIVPKYLVDEFALDERLSEYEEETEEVA